MSNPFAAAEERALTHIDLFSGIGGKISIDFSIPVCYGYLERR